MRQGNTKKLTRLIERHDTLYTLEVGAAIAGLRRSLEMPRRNKRGGTWCASKVMFLKPGSRRSLEVQPIRLGNDVQSCFPARELRSDVPKTEYGTRTGACPCTPG